MLIYPGVILIAVLSEMKNGVWNSQLLKVQAITDNYVQLTCLDTKAEYVLTSSFCQKYLRLSYALCYASLQGRTMQDTLRLMDLGHPRFNKKHLIVALSRAKTKDTVWLSQ